MSGFIIQEEMTAIEERFGISVQESVARSPMNDAKYYSQFELTVRHEATEMARHYQLFYCLEKSIRKLISETLHESDGANWWESGKVPEKTVEEVKNRIDREIDSGVTRRSDAPIDYTTFGELTSIIVGNWQLFETIFTSRRAVEKVLGGLNVLRGPIAHCCPLTEDEVLRLDLAVKDWFRMMG